MVAGEAPMIFMLLAAAAALFLTDKGGTSQFVDLSSNVPKPDDPFKNDLEKLKTVAKELGIAPHELVLGRVPPRLEPPNFSTVVNPAAVTVNPGNVTVNPANITLSPSTPITVANLPPNILAQISTSNIDPLTGQVKTLSAFGSNVVPINPYPSTTPDLGQTYQNDYSGAYYNPITQQSGTIYRVL